MADETTTAPKVVLGYKKQMTTLFDESGKSHAVTIVEAGPVTIAKLRTVEKDGYEAMQLGFGKNEDGFTHLREIRGIDPVAEGSEISAGAFAPGDVVHIQGVTKGKGFQGGVKRYNFSGGPRTHGQKHSEREGGSIGGGGRAGGRVAKGKKMPGRMGSDNITVKNLRILHVDVENNLLYVKGAVPGKPGTLLTITAA